MSSLCTEVDWQSLHKHGEELCGDHVEVITPSEHATVIVLADGLGSGVKASILSTLTAKIISTMIARSMPLDECVSTIAATLPVCSVRKIAYATFTLLHIENNSRAQIVQFDNPKVVLLRDGKHCEFPALQQTIAGKSIYSSDVTLREGDALVAFSDGVEHAGVGKALNFGWQRPDIIRFMEALYKPDSTTAHTLASALLNQCDVLYEGQPGDDATVCTVKVRRRVPVNLLIGPPKNPNDVDKVMDLFFGKLGRHIVCGGTTANLAAQHLNEQVDSSLPSEESDTGIPPIASINGIDLVTEGVITISKVLDYSQEYLHGGWDSYDMRKRKDGASRIATMLFEEATDISFFVGKAMNPAHQNPHLPINFSIKMHLVQELVSNLEQMGKRVKASYF